MPVNLEKELALSALPPDLRAGATVYLLDPEKGYYVAKKGSNGFICYVERTSWEWGEFRNDVAVPISYDAEGARTIFRVARDVAAMRASGKYTALQVQDTVKDRIRRRFYTAPARSGISYMLAPLMRGYTGKPGDKTVMTMNLPHYMFYAPYISGADVGINEDSQTEPFLINPGSTVLGERKGPFGFMIMTADPEAKAKILADNKDLLKRLEEFSPLFKVDAMAMH